jgi:hypothetical protein
LAGIGTAAAASLGLVIKKSVDLADEIAKTAKVVGVSAEALQELRFAAEQTGVEARGLDDSMRRLGRRVGEFVNSGAGPAQKAIEALGLEVRDAGGNVRSTEEIFFDLVDALQGVQSDAQRAAFAAQLFGDDFGPKLVPLLNQGRDGIEQYRQQARELGLVIRGDLLENAEELADKMNILNTALRAQFSSVVLENADSIRALTQSLTELIPPLINGTLRLLEFIGAINQVPITVLEENIAVIGQDLREIDARIESSTGRTRAALLRSKERLIDDLREAEDELKAAVARRNSVLVTPTIAPAVPTSVTTNSNGESAANEITIEVSTATQDAIIAWREAHEIILEDGEETYNELSTFAEQSARNMQDALANFLFDPFSDGLDGMLKGFINTMRRMAAEIASQEILRSLFGGFAGGDGLLGAFGDAVAGKRAMGGPVFGGRSYLVGENGPEIVRMGGSGYVTPNHQMGGGVTVQIDARGSDNPEKLLQLIPVIKNSIKSEIYSERRRGIGG